MYISYLIYVYKLFISKQKVEYQGNKVIEKNNVTIYINKEMSNS